MVTTSSDRGQALFSTTLPEKMVLVLGREYDYLPEAAREPDDLCVKINGTGNVESLNVSVATGVLLAEWCDRIKRKGCSPVTQRAPANDVLPAARSDKALSRRYPGDKTASRQRYSLSAGNTGVQSIVFSPCCSSHWFVSAKWLQPKNPRCAESGEGCGAFRIWWRCGSIIAPFFWACEPHSKKTTPSRCWLIRLITYP
ncbi:tRNA/rRNA methyltransferase YfiF [Salmonella enterica subsp. enterica]|uniref:tRNA/rRNA methyltransferase YfiF n=1 Tax=Salmonella enterica I TaxID=59201 RepID=A0A379WP14_SALET|nr:tRNA/rRNA methyltransferase YfiF [Salmonella enterica subsp. enterica]